MARHKLISLVTPYAKREETPFGSSTFAPRGGLSINCMLANIGEKKGYTQRPPIKIVEDASVEIGGTPVGRGIFTKSSDVYFVSGDTLYANNYSTPISTAFGVSGIRIFHAELDGNAIILNSLNSDMFVLSGFSTLTQVVDADYPGFGNAPMARGVEQLDGFIFVADEQGDIRNSDLGDALSWSALGTISAERESPFTRFVAKHHDHIVAFTPNSIEFFYNARNPTGSPLARRQDLAYNIGVGEHMGLTEVATLHDDIYFIGVVNANSGIYRVRNFRIEKISTSFIDTLLVRASFSPLSAFSTYGKEWLSFSIDDINHLGATGFLAYDIEEQFWHIWDYGTLPGITNITQGIIGTVRNIAFNVGGAHGILNNGDIFRFNSDINATELVPFSGVDIDSLDNNVPIPLEIITEQFDADNYLRKSQNRLDVLGQSSENNNPQPITVSWSDDSYNTFTTGKTMQLDGRSSTHRGGMFRRRAYKVTSSAQDRIWLEALGLHYNQHKN